MELSTRMITYNIDLVLLLLDTKLSAALYVPLLSTTAQTVAAMGRHDQEQNKAIRGNSVLYIVDPEFHRVYPVGRQGVPLHCFQVVVGFLPRRVTTHLGTSRLSCFAGSPTRSPPLPCRLPVKEAMKDELLAWARYQQRRRHPPMAFLLTKS
jgi:hypothetical protein